MTKFDIYAEVYGTVLIGTVTANSEAEALALGDKLPRPSVSLCHQCSTKLCDGLIIGDTVAEEQPEEEKEPPE